MVPSKSYQTPFEMQIILKETTSYLFLENPSAASNKDFFICSPRFQYFWYLKWKPKDSNF